MPSPRATIHDPQKLSVDELAEWTKRPPNPFIAPPFLVAAEHHGPGRGHALLLETAEGARWGVVERSRMGMRAALAYAGPSIPDGADAARTWDALLAALDHRGVALLRMNAHASLRLDAADLAAVDAATRQHHWRVVRKRFGTYVLDLTKDEEAGLAAMHSSHRRTIRAADREGLTLARLHGDGFEEYLALSDATYARQGMEGPRREYLRGLFDEREHFRFYLGRGPNGDAQAAVLVAIIGDTGSYLHGGSGHRTTNGAGNWLHWRVARALAEDGFRRYDLGGVDLDAEDGKAAGIRKFKERFGGHLEEHAALDVVLDPVRARVIEGSLDLIRKVQAARRAT